MNTSVSAIVLTSLMAAKERDAHVSSKPKTAGKHSDWQ